MVKNKSYSFFEWLFLYNATTDYAKLIAFLYKDHNFPRKTKDYGDCMDYLERIFASTDIMDIFEEAYDKYEEYLDAEEAN